MTVSRFAILFFLSLTLGVRPMPLFAADEPPIKTWRTAVQAEHPLVGRAWSSKEKRFLEPSEVVSSLASSDFVMLGEKHDNPDHHRLQAWLLSRLIATGRRPVVAFEMFDTSQTDALSAYQGGNTAADGLGSAMAWEKTGWPDWEEYAPIAQAALDAGLPLLGANLPRSETIALAGEGAPSEAAKRLGLDIPLDKETHAAMAAEIREVHCGMLPETAVPGMVTVQRAKDASMADALVKGSGGRDGGVLITGAGHARVDRAVPAHLKRLAPDATVASIAFMEVSADLTGPDDYGTQFGRPRPPFDVLWFTPRLNDIDPCERFATSLQKLKNKK